MSNKFCKKVKNIDIYMEEVALTFQKKKQFATWVGTFFTFITFGLFTGFTIMSTMKLVGRDDPFLSTSTMPREDSHAADLAKLGYVFAIQSLDPKAGSIEVKHTTWGQGKPKDVIDLELIDCGELYQSKEPSEFSTSWLKLLESVALERQGRQYWCPIYPERFTVRGHYHADHFDYVSVNVVGCALGDECYDDSQLYRHSINFLGIKAHPQLDGSGAINDELIVYTPDQTYFKYLDPEISQFTNIFFMESTVITNDNIFDVFKKDEKETQLI